MQELEKAMNEVYLCMIEKIDAINKETEAISRSVKAHYALQKAKERLQALEKDLVG